MGLLHFLCFRDRDFFSVLPLVSVLTPFVRNQGASGRGARGPAAAPRRIYYDMTLYHTILYYIILYYTILYYIILYYTILYYIILFIIV